MACLTVTTPADVVRPGNGKLGLRGAITFANGSSASDTIVFASTAADAATEVEIQHTGAKKFTATGPGRYFIADRRTSWWKICRADSPFAATEGIV